MKDPHLILKQYWKFDQFRPLQEEIVNSVLQGNDCLALLPTGGGKSVCFQVPALCMGKLCLVVSPLIALMKDQVEQLEKRGIPAGMIASSMHQDEVFRLIQKALKNELAFLYVSPERLGNDTFLEVLPELPLGLLAIDEAHCISQWGYDFRPAYLKIAEIRPLIPKVPVIALTATATPEVAKDICDKLNFTSNRLFQKSFLRPNLAYVVRNTEDKHGQLLRILQRISGSSVVYVRNRKRCRDLAEFLNRNGISASYYHAGLDAATRSLRQQQWIENTIRVIVCTNAFGMGIDKPDVRTVVHMDMPDTPEAYFQEAGRAGRDEAQSWAILLNDPADEEEASERFLHNWPGFDTVKAVYNWMGNFLQLPVGAGAGEAFPFDLTAFVNRYNLHPIECMNALKYVESQGFITFQEHSFLPSRLLMKADREGVYEFELRNPSFEPLIKAILRSYGGTFNDFVNIRESDLAERVALSLDDVKKRLQVLHTHGLLIYQPSSDTPQVYFSEPRHHPDRLPLSLKAWDDRKQAALKRFETMMAYLKEEKRCRSSFLVNYFGEQQNVRCGMCDTCIDAKKKAPSEHILDQLVFRLDILFKNKVHLIPEIMAQLPGDPSTHLEGIRTLIDENIVVESAPGTLHWK